MMVEIYKFNANFTNGLMKGLVMEQTMNFPSEECALDWVVRVNENNRNDNCDFWVSDLEYVEMKEIGQYA